MTISLASELAYYDNYIINAYIDKKAFHKTYI